MTTTLSLHKRRQLEGKCVVPGCLALPLEDRDRCPEHHAKDKAAKRRSAAKRRRRLRKQGRCVVCQRRSETLRCQACAAAHVVAMRHARARVRRGVERSDSGVERKDQIPPPTASHWKTETYSDGSTRTRYVGRASRGGPSREEMLRSRLKLVADAERLIASWVSNCDAATNAAIDAMPRIQRAAAIGARTSALVRAARLLALVAEEEDSSLKGTILLAEDLAEDA